MGTNFRITTNGLYRTYRTNLNKNNKKLSDAMIGVETQRKFNSYAEDPAAASKAWRLRRSYWRTGDQIDNNSYIISKYESAYSAMTAVIDGDVGNGEYGLGLDGILSSVKAISDSAGSSRTALGKELRQVADNIVSMMNSKYGDEFIFAGSDGRNVPFEWNEDKTKLLYRGVDVSTPKTEYKTADFGVTAEMLQMEAVREKNTDETDEAYAAYQSDYLNRNKQYATFQEAQSDYEKVAAYKSAKDSYEEAHPEYSFEDALKLNDMAGEATYVDIGLGMQERDDSLIHGSAFNSAVSGLEFLGYGKDENLVMVIKELGEIFSAADEKTGAYASDEDRARADELLDRLQDGVRYSQDQHVQLSADSKYLKTNLKQLETVKSELDKQIVDTEDLDMAEAITSMTWAQYCYNAALRIGTNILSQSLIDYMS